MPMLPVDVDPSTLVFTSIASAAVVFAFCVLVGEVEALMAGLIAGAVGVLLYFVGVIPIGLLIFVGGGMLFSIAKAMSRPPESGVDLVGDNVGGQTRPSSPEARSAKLPEETPASGAQLLVSAESVLSPFENVRDAVPSISAELDAGTQVPVLLLRVFPRISFAHRHQINRRYVQLRSEANSKIGSITHALDEYLNALGRGG